MMTAEAGTKPSPPSGTIQSLEQRYIALLEEKIARLEEELSAEEPLEDPKSKANQENGVKDANSMATSTDKAEEGKQNTADKASPPEQPVVKKKKNPRIRWIARRYNAEGEQEDLPDEEEPLKGELNKDEPHQGYAITWRRVYLYSFIDSSNTGSRKPYNKELLIESAALRNALTEVAADDYASMSFDTKEVVIPYPYACIFHSRAKLEEYAKTARADVREDIDILISEVFAEIENEVNDAKRLGEKKVITFDLLWTLFRPRGLVFATPIMNQPQAFLVNSVSTPNYDIPKQEQRFVLWVYSMDYTGKEFNRLDITLEIKYFEGAKPICGLQVYPLEWYEDGDGGIMNIEKLKERLIQRGRRFEELCNAKRGKQMFAYHGQVIDEGQDYLLSATGSQADDEASSYRTNHGKVPSLSSYARKEELPPGSQVMVDFEAFFQHGGKTVSVGALEVTRCTDCCCSPCTKWARDYDGFYPGNTKASKRSLTENQLLICPPRVLGFALMQKSWVQLLVDRISPLKTEGNRKAFDLLELAEKTKQLIKALVEQHTKNNSRVNDLIPGKGNGLIVLLHGPPGVGKTLTAESVALLTGKPLYSISMSDIGLSSSVAETNLIRIFDLAVRWEAILLFDEADVFLESRSLSNLQRNGLVSMLLRVLEYYHGILFLTTNRVKTFDEAFQSRVHIAIKYEELNHAQRRKIWLMWLSQLSPELTNTDDEAVEEEIEDLSNEPFNGRQIRNIVTSAQALARSKSKYGKTTFADIVKVVKVTKEFQVYLNQSSELAKMQMLR